MFCVIALIVFSLLGIFSATHRQLAKEALDCVFRRVTFRPCRTGFKEKIKGRILARLLNRSSAAAKIFSRHFELLSWIFFILMVVSTVWTIKSGVNFYLYGNCNGAGQEGFCLFDPTGENGKTSPMNNTCSTDLPTVEDLTLKYLNLEQYQSQDNSSENEIIFIGCYGCDYSRKAYPTIKKLLEREKPNFTFIHFPIKRNTDYLSNYGYCLYRENPDKFWEFNDLLFTSEKEDLPDSNYADSLVEKVGADKEKIKECVGSEETKKLMDSQYYEIQTTNIYGTPTIFINGQPSVGAKPYRVYKRMLGRQF